MTIIRALLAVAAVRQCPLVQLNMTNSFLHDHLSKEVYMTPRPGLPHHMQHVCRPRRVIYSLKQVLKALFERFCSVVLAIKFT